MWARLRFQICYGGKSKYSFQIIKQMYHNQHFRLIWRKSTAANASTTDANSVPSRYFTTSSVQNFTSPSTCLGYSATTSLEPTALLSEPTRLTHECLERWNNVRTAGNASKGNKCSICTCYENIKIIERYVLIKTLCSLAPLKFCLQAHTSRAQEAYAMIAREVASSNSPTLAYPPNLPPSENILRQDKELGDSYICDICGSSEFKSENELIGHKKLHHVKTKVGQVSLQCAYCNEHCKSRSDLENHMKNHQINSGKGKHKCNICDEIFSSAITLAEHKLSHCKIVSGNTCTQCKTVLIDEQSFYSHQLQHSAVLNKNNAQISLPANCIVCCQTLQTDVEIKLHANFHLQHLSQKEFLCSICNRVYDTRTGMPITMYEKSGENLQVSLCRECISKCSTSSTSSSPMQQTYKGDGEKIYSCLTCSLTFDNESDIKKHATSHMSSEGTGNECHLCSNIFPTPLQLQLHVIEHSFFGTGQFSCYICSSVFTTASGLLTHMLEHGSNSKPYECSNCQMKFFFQTELDNHKFDHILSVPVPQTVSVKAEERDEEEEEYKPVKCPYCDVASPSNIENHINSCPFNPEKPSNGNVHNSGDEGEEKDVPQNEDRLSHNKDHVG